MTRIDHPADPMIEKLEGFHLFGFDGAPCSRRVSFALAEKQLPRGRTVPWRSSHAKDCRAAPGTYTFRPVSLIRGEHLTAAYASINPNMVVPAFVHDGVLHIESMDIVDYLDHIRSECPLRPRDPHAATLCTELVELGKSLHVSVRYVSFRWGLRGLGRIGTEQEKQLRELERADSPERLAEFYARYNRNDIDEAVYLGHLRALEEGWRTQDARLATGGPFLTGASFSMADIIWALKVQRILECGYPFAQAFPALAEWFDRIRRRPAFHDGVSRSQRVMSLAFRAKAGLENLLGTGLRHAGS